jgi:hypothetical protein
MSVARKALMHFVSYVPTRLPGLVAGIWEQRSAAQQRLRILPSGKVELIFRLGPTFSLLDARKLRADSGPIRDFCFLSGLHTRPLDLSFNAFHVFGVQLHPVAVPLLLGIPTSELTDGAIEGDLVFEDLARVEDGLRSASDFPSRAAWMEDELLRRLWNRDGVQEAEAMRKLASLLPHGGDRAGPGCSPRLGYSRSQAHRICKKWFGQSVTGVIRLSRFVDAVASLHEDGTSLTELAYRLGYFDQAHFIRSFREFAGMTPGGYRRTRGALPGQLTL